MNTATERWQRVDPLECLYREREVRGAAEHDTDRAEARQRCERASSARWLAMLFEWRHVEISAENVAMFEEYLALLETGGKPAADLEVDGIVEAIDGIVVAAAYMAAETVGRPGGNYGHWIGRTLGQEQPGDRLRYSALCEERHWIEVSCVRDRPERGESGGVILDAKLTAHRSGLEPSTITVATGRLIVGPGRRIGFLGGLEVTDEADDWLWNDVAAFEAVTDPALEDGLEL